MSRRISRASKFSKNILYAGTGLFFLCLGVFFLLPQVTKISYQSELMAGIAEAEEASQVRHLKTPEPMKALYMTACVAGTPSSRERLKKLIEETELNAVVIDIKDSTGVLSFYHQELQGGESRGCKTGDLPDFIKALHESGIYVMGRISVFQDPYYAKLYPELAVKSKKTGGVWKDHKGLSFIDVGAKAYWDYILKIANTSYELGFDELNFDYVRYPSDGDMADAKFDYTVGTSTKPEMLESFFAYLHENLKDSDAVVSADLFGMTTTVTTDMNIGQVLERALPYFDYVYPMVYPSHYSLGWEGFKNPAVNPYEVVKISMSKALEREQAWNIANGRATSTPSKLRPWIQDFDLGADYDVAEVRAQIKAANELGITSWLIWNASNKYTESALLPE